MPSKSSPRIRKGRVAVRCSMCGWEGQVNRNLLGRRLRCRECDESLTVGEANERPQADGELIEASCLCGWSHMVLTSQVGRRIPCRDCGEEVQVGEGELERDLRHEAHVRAIAAWCGLGFFLFAILVLALAPHLQRGRLFLGRIRLDGTTLAAIMSGAMLLGLVHLFVGHGLWLLRRPARLGLVALMLLTIVGDALLLQASRLHPVMMVSVALSVLWTAAVLWALWSPAGRRVFHPQYARLVARQPKAIVSWWMSPFFMVPMWMNVFGVLALVAMRPG